MFARSHGKRWVGAALLTQTLLGLSAPALANTGSVVELDMPTLHHLCQHADDTGDMAHLAKLLAARSRHTPQDAELARISSLLSKNLLADNDATATQLRNAQLNGMPRDNAPQYATSATADAKPRAAIPFASKHDIPAPLATVSKTTAPATPAAGNLDLQLASALAHANQGDTPVVTATGAPAAPVVAAPLIATPAQTVLHKVQVRAIVHPPVLQHSVVYQPKHIVHHAPRHHRPVHVVKHHTVAHLPKHIVHHAPRHHRPVHAVKHHTVAHLPKHIVHHAPRHHRPVHAVKHHTVAHLPKHIVHHAPRHHRPVHAVKHHTVAHLPKHIVHHAPRHHRPVHALKHHTVAHLPKHIVHHMPRGHAPPRIKPVTAPARPKAAEAPASDPDVLTSLEQQGSIPSLEAAHKLDPDNHQVLQKLTAGYANSDRFAEASNRLLQAMEKDNEEGMKQFLAAQEKAAQTLTRESEALQGSNAPSGS